MPDGLVLAPFRALRYDAGKVGDLATVLSPPYDVIDSAGVDRLEAANPYNVVRLILPRGSETGPDSRYTRVVYTDGEALIRTPLKELLAQLDPQRFWQIHRSVVVNQRCIASAQRIDEGTMVLTLRGRDEKLPVSRHFQSLFRGQ